MEKFPRIDYLSMRGKEFTQTKTKHEPTSSFLIITNNVDTLMFEP